jgi:hypothetical protein
MHNSSTRQNHSLFCAVQPPFLLNYSTLADREEMERRKEGLGHSSLRRYPTSVYSNQRRQFANLTFVDMFIYRISAATILL